MENYETENPGQFDPLGHQVGPIERGEHAEEALHDRMESDQPNNMPEKESSDNTDIPREPENVNFDPGINENSSPPRQSFPEGALEDPTHVSQEDMQPSEQNISGEASENREVDSDDQIPYAPNTEDQEEEEEVQKESQDEEDPVLENSEDTSFFEAAFKCSKCPQYFGSQTEVASHYKTVHSSGGTQQAPDIDPLNSPKRSTDEPPSQGRRKKRKVTMIRGSPIKQKMHPVVKIRAMKGNRKPDENENRCLECREMFTDSSALRDHIFEENHNKQFKCYSCNKWFLSKKSLDSHKDAMHPNIKTEPSTLENISNSDIDRSSDEASYNCLFCDQSFLSRAVLKRHTNTHHKGATQLECRVCHKKLPDKQALKKHLQAHKNRNRKSADVTVKDEVEEPDSPEEDSPSKDIDVSASRQQSACEICSKLFSSRGNMMKHMRRHTGDFRYQCKLCEKKYIQSWDLKMHMCRFHGVKEEDAWATDGSEQGDGVDGAMAVGMKEVAGRIVNDDDEELADENDEGEDVENDADLGDDEEGQDQGEGDQVACLVCEKVFTSKGNLVRHMRRHKNDLRFECQYCGKRCLQNTDLKKHIFCMHGDKVDPPHGLNLDSGTVEGGSRKKKKVPTATLR